jgi:hypothetical protein
MTPTQKLDMLAQLSPTKDVTMMQPILCHVFVAWGHVDGSENYSH